MKPKRPSLRYYGGKWRLAPWIISHFPDHSHYIEVCGGSASVLLRKDRSTIETYNDLDGNVVNFFRVLRDRPDDLIRAITLTPWAREEFTLHKIRTDDELEKARRFWVGAWMSIDNMAFTKSGMRLHKSAEKKPGKTDCRLQLDQSHLEAAAQRLIGVQIENLSFEAVLKKFDGASHLFYVDPPYLTSTRRSSERYIVEWSQEDHRRCAAILSSVKGYAIVSGYHNPLYESLYEDNGWARVDKASPTNTGGNRIESLWLSPNIELSVPYGDDPRQICLSYQC